METTINIIKQHVCDYTYNPKHKMCINHYHSSVIVNSTKSGKNTLLLGAMPTMNFSEKHVNNEKDNHSLLTVCERAQVLSPSGVKPELPKKINRRDDTLCRHNENRDNINDVLMQDKINSDYIFQNYNE